MTDPGPAATRRGARAGDPGAAKAAEITGGSLARGQGVALWRQIASAIERDIATPRGAGPGAACRPRRRWPPASPSTATPSAAPWRTSRHAG